MNSPSCTKCAVAAARARSTPHFKSKEDIYAGLVLKSLDSLTASLDHARRGAKQGTSSRVTTIAFYDYFGDRLFEFELGLYTFRGHERGALGKERDKPLNGRLEIAILNLEKAMLDDISPVGKQDVKSDTFSLFTFLMGALTVFHARRDRSLGYSARDQVLEYTDRLTEIISGR